MRRSLQLTASGLLGALVLVLALAPGCSSASGTAASAAWALLPDDVIAVMHLDVTTLSESELFRAVDARYGDRMSPSDRDYAELMEQTGFDPRTDLEAITIGVGGGADDDDGPVYMIVRGAFDQNKIQLYARDHAEVETGSLDGLTTYRLQLREGQPGPPSKVAWLDEGTLILASEPDFPKLARSARDGGGGAGSSALARLLAATRGQAYFAMEIPEAAPQQQGDDAAPQPSGIRGIVASQLQGPLGTLQTLLFTMDAAQGLDLALRAEADNENNGRLVHEMLTGYVALGRLMAGENPELASLLERLKLERTGTVVSLSMSMTTDEVLGAIAAAEDATGGSAVAGE